MIKDKIFTTKRNLTRNMKYQETHEITIFTVIKCNSTQLLLTRVITVSSIQDVATAVVPLEKESHT